MTDVSPQPLIVSAGEALTDLVRTGEQTWTSHAGGAGWNVARAAASLGVPSAFAGAVGHDVFGDEIWRVSVAAGLDVRFLQQVSAPTLMAVVHQVHPPAYMFLGENSADLHFQPDQLPTGWMRSVRWIHLGGISLARAPLNTRLLELAERARDAGAKVSFDPNARNVHGNPAYRPMFERTLQLADVIKLSDEDVRFFYPESSEAEAVNAMRELNPGAPLIVTRGGEGASLFADGERRDFEAVRVEVIDTVGAGDAFVAGLLTHAVRDAQAGWSEHIRFALTVGAAACTRAGAYAPTLADLTALS
ncbi:carbohydrate kinase family protein [Deinococcus peraridilitoris]|uniref:Sugar kinase, ribokinase n=1 Tax=Deinococcus peraridilitoris (strain DSM 19664 / LMG 22246 / CIP 109416 / KR-200) TaxID=937777 RepID=L0A509_DEIPD|nr:carbohydrate kinase [Deinococcus peraridilitoris]AFZ68951.1 sugar kinase, ribokinase [Deinococcus peraridilitoris DSM 19664]